jgi:two-component system, OmpR family, phosphate regulon response regulator PhoB
MTVERILIVEDDKNIAKLVKYNLDKTGYESCISKTGEEALKLLEREKFDLIVLDIMLPKMNGFEVCKELKGNKKFSRVPIIMLTAKGEEVDRVVGLELGADDYVVKPFSPRELILRIKAVLKRGTHEDGTEDILRAGGINIDIPRHTVSVGGKAIKLTSLEFKLLVTLIERKGRVQSRDHLLNYVWDIEADITTRTVDTHIKSLRQKLGKAGRFIETVRGIGYRFKE